MFVPPKSDSTSVIHDAGPELDELGDHERHENQASGHHGREGTDDVNTNAANTSRIAIKVLPAVFSRHGMAVPIAANGAGAM
jgi:hypothetical protein